MTTNFANLLGTGEPVTSEPTLEEKKQAFAAQFRGAMATQFRQRVQVAKELYDAIWKNAALSPKQAISALGTDAKAAFAICQAEAAYLNQFKPGAFKGDLPEGVTVTFKADGSLDQYNEA